MGYEVQSQNCPPGQSIQFTFQKPVQSFVVGLGQFFLMYGVTTNYWIETLSISLEPSQPSANVVEVTPAVTMQDHSGHSIDTGGSFLWVVCVAMTGNSDQNTILTNVPGVTPTQSQPVTLPGTGGGFSVLEVCLSGLDLSYDTADHRFQGAKAIPGITPRPQGTGSVTAQVDLWDDSGHLAVTASIGAGVLASVDPDGPGFMVGSLTYQAGTPATVSYQFPSSVGGAVALIQSFTLQYASGNYSVQALLVGAQNLRINGDTVLIDAYVYTTDGEHSTDDEPQSSVKLLVVAIPPSAA